MASRKLRIAEPSAAQVAAYQAGRAAVHARTQVRYGGEDPPERHPSLRHLETGD